jgi:hypothetical protein
MAPRRTRLRLFEPDPWPTSLVALLADGDFAPTHHPAGCRPPAEAFLLAERRQRLRHKIRAEIGCGGYIGGGQGRAS